MVKDETLICLEADKEDDDLIDYLIMELLSSSDEEEDQQTEKIARANNKDRNFLHGYARVVQDYFNGADSFYDEKDFERRFSL
jgi:hypothetical protein